MLKTLFGTETVENIFLYLENYDEGSPSGIARTFGMNKNRVYTQLLRLEKSGLLVARAVGNLRLFSINPRLYFRMELKSLLRKRLDAMSREEFDTFYAERRRPRRTGKPA